MPSLCSVSRVETPFQPRSTTNAEIPLCLAAGSVFANTSWWSATDAYADRRKELESAAVSRPGKEPDEDPVLVVETA